ncbi:NADH-quinone oxidoreductase subunit J [Campylobacter insulaenigrae]|uniref:NADH-quinone oxidoreductase subunit J n=2 Tax=Campylobacter insulaenigrae TaxID=260714 RepID=A0A0A8H2M1_9BACT|nr:NADH-quinone oxidoreductase subunit J [Campylobacter insulaenigrae]AJC88336.1 NADH:quinone oxidoreductase I, membrane subunit J [Campylobacter insulaenigrae NCTC 12927]MCR6571390.1 NADH-quinone oxidoreductase subunit J [Campylobacter insulaenigrae]MCR6572574.1 NADH-quinone oxidoreductase subunit J [Campylobacter insulaenigrae]MCR6573940.1 NADH-quinone oxidoreductase subunit J [Campylobacter insulaenigrae]MCR6575666.1 NADH-quinone oxidoreductase subunit J [Campylobacter insulaenigrae]
MFETLAFYILSILVLGFFLVSVLSTSMLYAISSLAAAMIFLSGFYFLLNAEFIGVIQIIVYSGAILGLYSFAMMFFDASSKVKEKIKDKKIFVIVIFSTFLFIAVILGHNMDNTKQDIAYDLTSIQQIGLALFTKYMLAFEFMAVLLLIALICAIVLTQKNTQKDEQ